MGDSNSHPGRRCWGLFISEKKQESEGLPNRRAKSGKGFKLGWIGKISDSMLDMLHFRWLKIPRVQ